MQSYRYVIVGNGAAGLSAYAGIRQHDRSGSVAIISDEAAPIFSRAHLSYLISGHMGLEGIIYRPRSFYGREGISAMMGRMVVRIKPSRSLVELDDGEEIRYKRLLLATGSRPVGGRVPGADLKGCHTFWNMADVEAIRSGLKGTRQAVIVGGGPIGLKVAEALSLSKVRCTLVISSGHVLSQMLDQQTAEVVHGLLKAHKVRIITQADVERVEGVGGVSKVVLNNGKELPCQMVVFCKGVVPNMELARDALINVRKGIIVDEGMRTSAPNIFAAGDVAEAIDPVTGQGTVRSFWAKAMRQGHVAGENMAGGDARYQGDLVSNSLIVYGTTVLTMGHTRPDERDRSIVISAEGEGWFRRIVLREGRVIGAVLIGDITSAEALGCLLTSRSDASELTIKMLDRSFDKVMLAELGPLECPADNQNS